MAKWRDRQSKRLPSLRSWVQLSLNIRDTYVGSNGQRSFDTHKFTLGTPVRNIDRVVGIVKYR